MNATIDLPQKLIDYLNELRAPLPPLSDPDEPLRIDSLSLMRLLAFLEGELAIRVEDNDLDIANFETARVLGRLISKEMEKCPAGQVPDQMPPTQDNGELVN